MKFYCTKKHQDNYRKNSKNNNVYGKQIRFIRKKVLKALKKKLANFGKIE